MSDSGCRGRRARVIFGCATVVCKINASFTGGCSQCGAASVARSEPLSSDGTVALTGLAVSDDGALLAYGLSRAGSDWMEWRGARRANRSRPGRSGGMGEILRSIVEQRRTRIFITVVTMRRRPGNQPRDSTNSRSFIFTSSAPPNARTKLIYERRDHKEWDFTAASPTMVII
jgi:hypothetical protein